MIEEQKSRLRARPDGLTGPLKLLTLYTQNFDKIKADLESKHDIAFEPSLEIDTTTKTRLEKFLDIEEIIRYNIYQGDFRINESDITLRVIEIPKNDHVSIESFTNESFAGIHIHRCSKSDLINIEINLERQEEEINFFRKVLDWKEDIDHTDQDENNDDATVVNAEKIQTPSISLRNTTEEDMLVHSEQLYSITRLALKTKDVGEILARSHAHQIQVVKTPRKIVDPIFGEAIAMRILSPNGLHIDVYNLL